MIDKRKDTNLIVIHSSSTRADANIGAAEIDQWHRRRGFAKIGYHYVICRDGVMENGRAVDEVGNHARPRNHDSIGVCLIGGATGVGDIDETNFTDAQWDRLRLLLDHLRIDYPNATVIGHRDVPGAPSTECPGFDVTAWLAGG